jgi:hypothetical protein
MAELHSGNSSLPEPTRLMMRALEAAHGDRFQTGFYLQDKESGGQTLAWREAWRNPVTRKWEVTGHATLVDFYPGQEEGQDSCAERRQTLHTNLCFFDALYQCALFEVSERKFGHERAQKSYRPGQGHYAGFAEREGIPFDKSGMPLLAAYGRILSDGDYDEKAHGIAARSAPALKLHTAPETAVFNAPAFTANLPALAGGAGDLVAQRGRAEVLERAQKMDARLTKVITSLENCRKNGFRNNFGEAALFAAIPLVGQLFMLVALCNPVDFYKLLAPRNIFTGSLRRLRKEYNKLSGFVDTAPFEQFEQDALMTYQVLVAREGVHTFVKGGSQKKLDKCLAAFRKAAIAHGWSEDRAEQMLALIREDAGSKSFDDMLVGKLGESKNRIVQYMKEAEAQPRPPQIGRAKP